MFTIARVSSLKVFFYKILYKCLKMAGSIDLNKIAYKRFKYVAPTPPNSLIDNSNFTIDFAERKFIQIGIDPSSDFNVVIHLITASRYISITPELLQRIFSMMGNILSVILDPPSKARSVIFLKDNFTMITKMVYRGENNLVLESQNQDGCRVLLNRENLLALQDLETSILNIVLRKSTIIRPAVMNQITQIHEFLNREHAQGNIPMIFDEVKQAILRNKIPSTYEPNFMNELKLMAAQQVAERWYGHDEVDSKVFIFKCLI